MTSSKRFVVGIDDSDHARRALHWAIDEADASGAELDVVHAWELPFTVVPLPINPAYAHEVDVLGRAAAAMVEREVRAAVGGRYGAVRIEKIVVHGSAASALIETANGADLLIIGSGGHSGSVGWMLGSVSSVCVHRALCPVAVVRGDGDPYDDPSLSGHVVVGVDGSECSNDALIWAFERAVRRGGHQNANAAW
jgi:nucleotide-binding universal stress UspA family protein